MVDFFFEEVEGEGAFEEDEVVEGFDVEFGAELCLGFVAEFGDFELSHFVGECLSGPGDVAVDFVGDVEFAFGGVVEHEVDGLFA